MNDKDIMNDILYLTKGECELYMHGTIEASNTDIHNTFKNVLLDALDMQKQTFTTMQSKGWYQTQPIPQQKVDQAKQKLTTGQ